MSHSPIQPDNELLSAYIDGELTADELRAVEAWIESDPAARATLEELRGVSNAVQALPRASVPAEWTAKLAERLDDARGNSTPTSPSPHETNGHGDAMTSLPFGRTSRGWWWSAAAIAAAVAIMLSMPRDPNEREVATRAPIGKAPAAGGEIVMSAPDTNSRLAREAPASESIADAPAGTAPAEGEGIDSLALDSAAAPATMAAPAATPESTPEVADFAGIAGAPPAPSAEVREGEAVVPTENTYLIVWCDVPPDSLREKQINELLVGNGIVVDEETDTWLAAAEPVRQQIEFRNSGNYRSAEASTMVRGNAAPAPDVAPSRFAVPDSERDFRSRESLNRDRGEEAAETLATDGLADTSVSSIEGETILVEATADQIAGCLAAMQQDPSNFKSITIEPVSEMAIEQQMAMQRSLTPPAVAQTENQVAQSPPVSLQAVPGENAENSFAAKLAEEARVQVQQSRGGPLDEEGQQAAKNLGRAQARRLARPEAWYLYNAAPKEAQQGYRLPMLESKDGKAVAKSEYAYGDKKQQLAELNRYVAQQPQQQLAGRAMSAPLVEQQPVQVLFVLRNSLLPDPVAATAEAAVEAGTVEPASESPAVEAAE